MKKHESQMSGAEKEAIAVRVREIAETVISSHAADRMNQKIVSSKEIEICLKYGQAVELRHGFGRPKVAVCVVVVLQTGTIVTTWKNAGSDNHKTLNVFAYDKSADVLAMLGGR